MGGTKCGEVNTIDTTRFLNPFGECGKPMENAKKRRKSDFLSKISMENTGKW